MGTWWEEITVFVLAAAGFVACWYLLGRLFTFPPEGNSCTVVAGSGDGGTVEQTVRHLLWLRECGCGCGYILIVDCGLTEAGGEIACRLAEEQPGLFFCRPEDVSGFLRKIEGKEA